MFLRHAMFAALLVSAASTWSRADDDIVYAGWSTDGPASENKDMNNYVCVQVAACPAKVAVVDANGDWVGCYQVGIGCVSLVDGCVMCSGSNSPASICKVKVNSHCSPITVDGSAIPCGLSIEGDCSISGTIIGPNGCGCKFTTLTPNPLLPCNFNGCV